MKNNGENFTAFPWKKYLIASGIISLVLGIAIPEIIEYINLKYVNPKIFKNGIDIKFDGIVYSFLYRTLTWSLIFYGGSILIGFLWVNFKKHPQVR